MFFDHALVRRHFTAQRIKIMTQPAPQRFPLPSLAELPDDIRTRILSVQEKSGFVPNVFMTLARRPDEFRAFFAYHDTLMDKDGGLTKAEREMIVVATSAINQCLYCVIAHGAVLRIRAKKPLLADQIAVNYRKADITERQRRDAGFRGEGHHRLAHRGRSGFRRARRARPQQRRDLGHCRDRGVLRHVEPARQFHQYAAERRVLPDGTAAEGVSPRQPQMAGAIRHSEDRAAFHDLQSAAAGPHQPGR